MKFILLLLFLLPFPACAQFELKIPDVENLEAELKKSNFADESIYFYLTKNYDITSDKKDIQRLDYSEYQICSFKRIFNNNIEYYFEQCKEAGGVIISLKMPKASTQNLKLWIEKIHIIESGFDNVWDENKPLLYRPDDEGVGCWYSIEHRDSESIIQIYCGC